MLVAITLKGLINLGYLTWLSPMYFLFPIIFGVSLIASIIATYTTAPVDDEVLMGFYMRINPAGLWAPYADQAVARGLITRAERAERYLEKAYDLIGVCLSVPFQFCALVATMAFVFHDWEKFAISFLIALCTAFGLYFFWYRGLKSVEKCEEEDARYGAFSK